MHNESEYRLGIESHMIDDATDRIAPFVEDTQLLGAVAKGRIATIRKVQPEYVRFLSMTGFEFSQGLNPLTFASAVVLGYEMLPEEARNERFTHDEISASYESVQEYITREESGDAVHITINFRGLKEKLENDSPEFIEWVDKFVDALDDEKKKADTLFGLLLAVAPFYFRAEARRLAHELSQFGKE